MKLGARDIEGFLKSPGRVAGALVYGPDSGLVSQRGKLIAKLLLTDASDAFNRVDLTEEQLLQDPARLVDELAAMSLMGGRRFIWLRDAGDKAGSIIKDALNELEAQLSRSDALNYLLVTAGELSPRSPLRSIAESHPHLAALPCYKEEGASLGNWMRSYLGEKGIQIDAESLSYLKGNLSGDRMVMQSELDKLCLYYQNEKTIDLCSLRKVLQSDLDSSLDEACHAFVAGQYAQLMHLTDELLISGTQPIMLLRSVDRFMMKLQAISELCSSGKSPDEAVNSYRPPLFFKDKPRYKQYIMRWPLPVIKRTRAQLMRLEVRLKTQHETGEWQLKDGLLRLSAQGGRRSKTAA